MTTKWAGSLSRLEDKTFNSQRWQTFSLFPWIAHDSEYSSHSCYPLSTKMLGMKIFLKGLALASISRALSYFYNQISFPEPFFTNTDLVSTYTNFVIQEL